MDALHLPIDEIEPAGGIDRPAAERVEAAGDPRDGDRGRRRRDRRVGDVEHREFALAHLGAAGDVADRILIRIFAGTQIGAATGGVAGGETAFGVHMDVAEADAGRAGQRDRRRRPL